MRRELVVVGLGMLVGSSSMSAQSAAGFEVSADFGGDSAKKISHRGNELGGWSLDAVVEYHAKVPRIEVRGSYVTQQDFDSTSQLSYRIFDNEGTVLLAEGRRTDWTDVGAGELRAEFEIGIPQVHEYPTLGEVRIQFDAVVEHQFWYREKYPEMSFPEIRLTNIPARDHFSPGSVWVPRFFPAGFGAQIPARFSVSPVDSGGGDFVPALDVNTVDGAERVPSPRVERDELLGNQFSGWMPMDAHAAGTVMVRPGMVWENVRWYEANDWFPRRAVTFVSPIIYTMVMVGFLLVLAWAWNRISQIERIVSRRSARVGWGLVVAWFVGQMLMSGFWLVAGFFVVIGLLARSRQGWNPARTYAATWLYFGLVEFYWAQLESSVGTVAAGLWLSIAVWALLLAPLLLISRESARYMLAMVLTLSWTGLTFASVIYNQFFQDYPSIENMAYAGQLGELGDSVFTLIEQHHVLPILIWFLAAAIAAAGRIQRKTQIEKT